MASILRQIVAGPRARHPEARLDLCYVTDSIIVTSGPSSVWPKKAYRNPTDQLVAFLDKKHGSDWAIFEFRAEGTGYPDSEVYNRIHHFPWPDHHPPPFAIIPNLMAAMRNWIQGEDTAGKGAAQRVAVVHCKAGKGRSGTATCSYLISQEGWKREDALHRFTIRRMRAGFGNGVSIPSQLRWVHYVDRWTNEMGKRYTERPVEIVEVHVTGLRDGVKVGIEGFVDDGRRIKCFHTFTREEKMVVDGRSDKINSTEDKVPHANDELLTSPIEASPFPSTQSVNDENAEDHQNIILRPLQPVRLPTSDVNIDFERRNSVKYTGYTMVTSLAHVWWNAWFEGGHEGNESGVFELDWEAMDGIKGSARKGIRAFDRVKVVWKYSDRAEAHPVHEPEKGEPVPEGEAADWKGQDPQHENEARRSDGVDSNSNAAALTMGAMINDGAASLGKELGLRKSMPESADVSRASSCQDVGEASSSSTEPTKPQEIKAADTNHVTGVKSHGLEDGEQVNYDKTLEDAGYQGKRDTTVGQSFEAGIAKAAQLIAKVKTGESDDAEPKSHTTSK